MNLGVTMYNTVYEISFIDILPKIILIIILFTITFIDFIEVVKSKRKLIKKIFRSSPFVIILFVSIFLVLSMIADNFIYSSYVNSQYDVCEGKVENYISGSATNHTPEQFLVDGNFFEFYEGFGEFGYDNYGKLKNDDLVRISYIYDNDYNNNRIVKLEKAVNDYNK